MSLGSSENAQDAPVTPAHDVFLLLIISGLMLFLVLAGCMERQPVPDIKKR